MALIPGFINASGGAPSYDAAGLRMLDSHDLTPDGASSALTSRQGVRPSAVDGLKVTNTAFAYNVAPGYAVVSKASQGALGDYRVANSTVVSGTIPAAHATYARKDLVWLRVRDHDVDGSGVRTADVYYQQGTAAAVPVDPTPAPAGALLLARIDVPASGGGNPTVTDLRVYTVASGGVLPVATSAERDALTGKYDGMPVYVKDSDAVEVYDGAAFMPLHGGGAPVLHTSGFLGPGTFNNTARANWTTANYSFTPTRDGWAWITAELDTQEPNSTYGSATGYIKANGTDLDALILRFGGSPRLSTRFTARAPVLVRRNTAVSLAFDVSAFSASNWTINTLVWRVTVL